MSDNMISLFSRISNLEFELECAKARLNFVREYENCAVWEYSIPTKTMYLNRKFEGRFENTDKEIPDYRNKMTSWNLIHPEDREIFQKYCDSMDNGDEFFSYDYRQIVNDAMFVWVRNTGHSIKDSNGIPIKVVGKTLDISELMKRREDLIKLAEYDNLTGVFNKESFVNNVVNYINDENNTALGGSLFIIDIDNFKNINDTLGHAYGDSVIKNVALLLKSLVFVDCYIGRIGGDEFCIFVKGKISTDELKQIADYLNSAANTIVLPNNKNISFSIGISIFPTHSTVFSQLFDYADYALYSVKKSGKNGYEIFYPEEKTLYSIDLNSVNTNSITDMNSKVSIDYLLNMQVMAEFKMAFVIIDLSDRKITNYSPNIQRIVPIFDITSRLDKICDYLVNNYQNLTTEFSSRIEYNPKLGKFLNLNIKNLSNNQVIVTIKDATSYFNSVGRRIDRIHSISMPLTVFYHTLASYIETNKDFNLCALTINDYESYNKDVHNEVEALYRQVIQMINSSDIICVLSNKIIVVLRTSSLEESSSFCSNVLISFNAKIRTDSSSKTGEITDTLAYGALYQPQPEENAQIIMKNLIETLKLAYLRNSTDDHFYLINNTKDYFDSQNIHDE